MSNRNLITKSRYIGKPFTFSRRVGWAVLLFAASGWLAVEPARAETLSLEDCIRIGLERSIPLRQAQRNLVIARHNVQRVRAQAKPSVDVRANYTRIDDVPTFPGMAEPLGQRNTYAATAEAGQLLYAGGAVRTALRIARDYIIAAEAELERIEADLIRRITRGFYETLYYQEALEVATESVRQLEQLEERARQRFEADTLSEFEWLSAQVALANERPQRVAAENGLALAKRAFRDLIYLEEEEVELAGTLDLPTPSFDLYRLQDHGQRARPEMRQAEANISVARDQVRIAESEYRPELRAFATYGGADPSQRDPFSEGWEWEWTAGVRLTWSLFDGGDRRAQRRIRQTELHQERDRLHELTRAVALEIEQAWRQLKEARESLQGAQENVALARRALEIASVRFEQGLATHLDFTDSNLALSRARLNLSRAQLDVQRALADLTYAAGQPDFIMTPEDAPHDGP